MKLINKVILLLTILSCTSFYAQDTWQQIGDFPIESRAKTSFGLSNMGVVLTYEVSSSQTKVFQYEPNIGWEQKSDFPVFSQDYVSFVLNDEGYIMLPSEFPSEGVRLFKYVAANHTWEQKASTTGVVGGIDGYFGAAFAINDKGYLHVSSLNAGFELNEYDPITDTWTAKTSYPATQYEGGQLAFSANGKGYLVFAFAFSAPIYPLWEYDPATDSWSQKTDIPWVSGTSGVNSFSIDEKGYVGMNDSHEWPEFFRYLPITDTWEQIESCGYASYSAFGFSIGDIGYVGIGGNNSGNTDEVWRFSPYPLSIDKNEIDTITIYPNPSDETLSLNVMDTEIGYEIYCLNGRLIYQDETFNKSLDISFLSNGIYILKITSQGKSLFKKFIKN